MSAAPRPPRFQVEVDPDRCVGAGQCAFIAPEFFTQDDEGTSEVLPGREETEDDPLLHEAADACPVRAITIRER
ncbi:MULTISPECIES: ferredoxin [Streptomyces]|uniref:ferredoxin n=1 Tax=Streptomyces TaxID=1883 RepID=UPI000A8A4396|nr:ferredoxin [Streptomyces sp. SCSIO ZS0520]